MKLSGDAPTLSSNSFGYLLVVGVILISSLPSGIYYTGYDLIGAPWDENCTGVPENFTNMFYDHQIGEHPIISIDNYRYTTGSFRMIITIVYPIFGALLMFEIIKSARFASVTLSRQDAIERYRSGRMIMCMTIFYTISSLPGGAFEFIWIFINPQFNTILHMVLLYGDVWVDTFFCFNAAAHCLINFSMSRNYRSTVMKALHIEN